MVAVFANAHIIDGDAMLCNAFTPSTRSLAGGSEGQMVPVAFLNGSELLNFCQGRKMSRWILGVGAAIRNGGLHLCAGLQVCF